MSERGSPISIDTEDEAAQDFTSLSENLIRRRARPSPTAIQAVQFRRRPWSAFIGSLALAAAALLAACSGGDSDGNAATTPSSDPAPTSTLEIAPTQAPATPAAGAPALRPAADGSGDLSGVPFSTADVRKAIEAAGYSLSPVAGRAALCPQTSVSELPFWSANLAGSDSGPILVLWVYPSIEALAAEWQAEPGAPPKPQLDGCALPTGFAYWNQNLVLVFETWSNLGVESPVGVDGRIPGEHPAVQAFLAMTP